jgi:TolB-like protein/Tfp pilus assembly protein PilF
MDKLIYAPQDKEYLNKLNEIVAANIRDNSFGVKALAMEMGCSHATLHRKITALTSKSCSRFIREVRLEKAMELLKGKAGTVAEIAYDVGFSSTTYFTKCFHDYFGYPPVKVKKKPINAVSPEEISSRDKATFHPIRSLAILPFENYTGDDSKDYLILGMHDALIGELGKLRTVRVLSKTSVMSLTGPDKSIHNIAKELKVDGIIEASVLFADHLIKIHVKLIQVYPEETQLWSQQFDTKISNVLILYSQIIKRIACEIQLNLTPDLKTMISVSREVNSECYKAYLRGKYYLYQLTEVGMRKGLEYLLEAVSIDPAEALAHAGLALGYLEIAHSPMNPGDAYLKAESAALQALKLDPKLAEAHLALAEIYIYATWNYDKSEKHFRHAIELNPCLSVAHYHYAWLLFLHNRHDEAVVEHELAQKHDPFNPLLVGHTGILYAFLGRFEEAFLQVNNSFELQKDCPDAYFALIETHLAMGNVSKAIEVGKKFIKTHPIWKWLLGYVYASTGYKKEATRILDELLAQPANGWNALGIAGILGNLGQMEEAYKWMGYEPHHAWVPFLTVMPMGKPFRKDERFNEFRKRWNLSDPELITD